MTKKLERNTIKDWLMVLVLMLDEVAALVLVLLVLWIFKIKISLSVVIGIVLLLGALAFLTQKVIIPSFHKKKVTGVEGMIGSVGEVVEALTPVGLIKVAGEYWKAKSVDGDIETGEDVEILRVNRLNVEVKRKES